MKKILFFVLLLSSSQLLYSQIPVAEAWYPFCGNANDISGKNRNATVTNCSGTTSRFGQLGNGYNFGGSGYVDIPNSTIMGLDTYCYSLWIYLFSQSNTAKAIFSGGGNDIYDQGLIVVNGFLMAVSHNSGGSPSTSSASSPTLTLNKWHHVVVLRNSTLMRMYVDNVAYTGTYHNGTTARWGSTSPYNILLGVRSNGLDYYSGLMDDVRLYAGNLSTAQITSLYQEKIYPNMVAYGDTICEGESTIISATGANSYTLPGVLGVVNPPSTSTYSVIGSSQGCVATATAEVVVDACTSIGEYLGNNSIKIFPNPNNGHFKIDLSFNHNTVISYLIQDLAGRNIYHEETNGQEQIEINTELLPGTYILKVYMENKMIASKKLIVAH